MKDHEYPAIAVNLDPGAERLPYSPHVDVREWVGLSDVMNRFSVGPNGAQIICADMVALFIKEIKESIDDFRVRYVLIDTPGQIELFSLRETSRLVVDALGEKNLIAFLFDPILAKEPSGFVSLYLLWTSIHFRFQIPSACFLAKCDLLKQEEKDRIISWFSDFDKLYDALSGTRSINMELFKALENIGSFGALFPISSLTMFGMEDLYNVVQQIYLGGEDFV
jgi:hypothetical protein